MADINYVEPSNSFVGNLGPNASFVGPFWFNTQDFTSITFTARADQPPATNGIVFEWSTDGVNVDSTTVFGSDGATEQTVHSVVRAAFFKVRYTAGAGGSTNVRLQTLFRTGTYNASVNRVGLITGSPDALNSNAVVLGKASSTYQAVKAIPDPQTPTDYYLMVGPPPSATQVLRLITAANTSSVQIDFAGIGAPTRRALTIFNNTIRGKLFISTTSPALTSNYHHVIPPQHHLLMPMAWPTYRGPGATLFGIWDVADGNCVVTEYI